MRMRSALTPASLSGWKDLEKHVALALADDESGFVAKRVSFPASSF
jgi:hypothetical protein